MTIEQFGAHTLQQTSEFVESLPKEDRLDASLLGVTVSAVIIQARVRGLSADIIRRTLALVSQQMTEAHEAFLASQMEAA